MRVPRDLSSSALIKSLARLDYEVTRQTGSHILLRTRRGGEHNITVPAHDPIKLGTLTSILRDVAAHFQMTRDQLLETFFHAINVFYKLRINLPSALKEKAQYFDRID